MTRARPPIRVLVVDDSETARTLLTDVLRGHSEFEVVGEARDGIEGVELTARLRPDVITMDLQMPRLDGFAATREIMAATPTPIVVITATAMGSETETAVRALSAGALTVLRKLPSPGTREFDKARRELVATIKAMAEVKVVRKRAHAVSSPHPPHAGTARGRIVAIATSTGGPQALQALLAPLPKNFPTAILVVQHITQGFLSGFATWLAKVCALRVKEAVGGEPLLPGTVYLGPDGRHLGVASNQSIELSSSPPIGGFRPSGTHLFLSVAETFGSSTVATILTGMGRDGVEGLRAVRRAGGTIIAQDEKTSVVFGMPGEAVAAGLPDLVLPIDEIPAALVSACASAPAGAARRKA